MVNKMDKTIMEELFGSFGLSPEEQEVYLALLKQPQATPLALSRATSINRTTLYRVLEALSEKGLIEEIMDYKSKSYRAAPPEQLNLLLSKKESEVESLREQLPKLIATLREVSPPPSSPTRVLYFKGISGLRQLLYNTLRAKDEVVGYGYGSWNDGVGRRFAEKIRREYVEKNIASREILNAIDALGSYTSISGYFNGVYHHRKIQSKILTITHDTYIYNDVFAFYHITGGQLFGVEIHNEAIATTQKQIFEILWKQASPASKYLEVV